MRNKTITEKDLADLTFQHLAEWNISDFEVLLEARGYDVFHERAVQCPCKVRGGDNLVNCTNCLGTGWIFLNKNKTRMVIQSMNVETKYKDWTEEKIGTASITAKFSDRLAFMDRITLENSEGVFNQILYPILYNNQLFAYTIYDVTEVLNMFVFNGENMPLRKLTFPNDYTFENNKIMFSNSLELSSIRCSIVYTHPLQYHIIDLNKEVRNTFNRQLSGDFENTEFPVFAVMRRSHYVLDAENYLGNLVKDNT
ncbi:MAG TPA: hypothetical protein PKY56_00165 [Candidatus Kapabacteria bacterium]|nr:hypothetical protein [Candidatus Kapabacteria bacterium]